MAISAELQIVITAVNNAKSQIVQIISDVGKLKGELSSINTTPVSSSATQGFKNIGKAANDVKSDIEGAGTSLTTLNEKVNLVGRGLKFLAGGFLALKSVQALKGFADDAARAKTLEVVLFQIGKNAGFTRNELRATDAEIQKLGITAQASRQSLSQFLQSGLKLEDASKLARAAQDLAVIAGENSSDTFQRLITNIQQVDTVGLRFLGITVDIDKASAKYAQTLGVTAQGLTRQQKQQGLLNEVLERSVDLQGTYEAALDTNSKKLGSLDRVTKNLSTSLGESLQPAYGALIDTFTSLLQELTKVSDDFNDSQTAAEAFGESVRTIAEAVKDTILFLVEFKELLIVVGELFVVGKIIQYAQALFGVATGATAATSAFGGLRAAVAFLGGPLSVVIGLLTLLYTTSETARNLINAFGLQIINTVARAIQPGVQAIAVLIASFVGIKAALSGGDGSKAFSDSLKASLASIDAGIKKTGDGAKSSFAAAFKGGAEAANEGANKITRSVGQVITSYKTQNTEVARLTELYNKQKDAGKNLSASETANLLKKARAERTRTENEIDRLSNSAKTSKADKEKANSFLKEQADLIKSGKAYEAYGDAIAEAKKNLGLDKLNVTKDGVFSAESTRDIDGFRALYVKAVGDTKASSEDAKIAVNELKAAFDNLTKSAKTPDDFKALQKLIAEVETNSNSVAKAILPSATADLKEAKDKTVKKTSSAGKSAKTERKNQIKADADFAIETTASIADIERNRIESAFKEVDRLYKKGILSVKEYYDAKRALTERDGQIEVNALAVKLTSIDTEIASGKKSGLSNSEITQLKTKRLDLEKDIAIKTADIAEKQREINDDEVDSQKEVLSVTKQTSQELLELRGKTAEAKNAELDSELESRLEEVKGKDEAAVKERENIVQLIALKKQQVIFDVAEIDYQRVITRLKLAQETIDLNRRNGLINELQAKQQILAINQQAADELDAILPKLEQAANALGEDAQNNVKGYKNELASLKIVVDDVAVSLNGTFKESGKTLFKDILSGTKSAKDALLDFFKTINDKFQDILAEKAFEQLFGGITGSEDGGESGGIGGFFSKLLGLNPKTKEERGNSPNNALYVQDVAKGLGGIDTPKKEGGFFDSIKEIFTGKENAGGLPDIAPVDDVGFDPLPEFVQANLGEEVTPALEGFFTSVDTGFANSTATSGGFFSSIGNSFQNVLGNVSGLFTGGFFETIKGGLEGLTSIGQSVFSSIGGFLTKLLSSISGGGSGGGGGGDFLSTAFSFIGSFFADGGYVSGAGTGTSDSIPARLSNGEFVVRASQTAQFLPLLHMINDGRMSGFSTPSVNRTPFFAEGGLVDIAAQSGDRPPANQNKPQTTRIVNVIDPAMAGEYLQSSAGEKVLLNFIGRNKAGIKNSLR